jgi:hypothetical protein
LPELNSNQRWGEPEAKTGYRSIIGRPTMAYKLSQIGWSVKVLVSGVIDRVIVRTMEKFPSVDFEASTKGGALSMIYGFLAKMNPIICCTWMKVGGRIVGRVQHVIGG